MATAALAAGLAACSPAQDMATANAQIAAFHRHLDAGDFEAIDQTADPLMKAGGQASMLVPILSAVHRKLGGFKSGSTMGWNDNINTQGHFLAITYAAKYERGDATESFVYRIDATPPRLAGYHINSAALILN